MELYSPALAARPEVIVVTKLDLTGSEEARERIATELCREVTPISAVTGKGIPILVHRIGELLDRLPPPADPAPVVRSPAPGRSSPSPQGQPAARPRAGRGDVGRLTKGGASAMLRIVADLGNSRLKWGRVAPDGSLDRTVALPGDDPAAWAQVWDELGPDCRRPTPPGRSRRSTLRWPRPIRRHLEGRGVRLIRLSAGRRARLRSATSSNGRKRRGPTAPWRWSGPWPAAGAEGPGWSSRAGRP